MRVASTMQSMLEEQICGCCMCDSGRSPSLWYDALLCCIQSYMKDILDVLVLDQSMKQIA